MEPLWGKDGQKQEKSYLAQMQVCVAEEIWVVLPY